MHALPSGPRSRRCMSLGMNWPLDEAYRLCPVCGEPTKLSDSPPDATPEGARWLARQAQFHWWLVDKRRL